MPKEMCFNPGTRTGCDKLKHPKQKAASGFNPRTHTGCDIACNSWPTWAKSFNPRTHTGCDQILDVFLIFALLFQSTHPHGVRQAGRSDFKIGVCFNPRTHTGCDLTSTITYMRGTGFNPRTHTGCDSTIGSDQEALRVSIHAPTRGATQFPLHVLC